MSDPRAPTGDHKEPVSEVRGLKPLPLLGERIEVRAPRRATGIVVSNEGTYDIALCPHPRIEYGAGSSPLPRNGRGGLMRQAPRGRPYRLLSERAWKMFAWGRRETADFSAPFLDVQAELPAALDVKCPAVPPSFASLGGRKLARIRYPAGEQDSANSTAIRGRGMQQLRFPETDLRLVSLRRQPQRERGRRVCNLHNAEAAGNLRRCLYCSAARVSRSSAVPETMCRWA